MALSEGWEEVFVICHRNEYTLIFQSTCPLIIHGHYHRCCVGSGHLIPEVLEIEWTPLPLLSASRRLRHWSYPLLRLPEEYLLVAVHHHAPPLRLILGLCDGRAQVHHVRPQLIPLRFHTHSVQLLLCLVAVVYVSRCLIPELLQLHLKFLLLAPHFSLKLVKFQVESALYLLNHGGSHEPRRLLRSQTIINIKRHVCWVDVNVSPWCLLISICVSLP